MMYLAFILYVLGAFHFHGELRNIVDEATKDMEEPPPVMPLAVWSMCLVWPVLVFIDLVSKD